MKRRLELVTAIGLAWRASGQAALADDDAHQATTQKAAADKQPIKVIAGHWLGTLDAGVKLRVVVNIEQSPEGKLTATLDSPDQGAQGHPRRPGRVRGRHAATGRESRRRHVRGRLTRPAAKSSARGSKAAPRSP